MSNKLTKLLISFTTAAALGATAVINNNHPTNPVAQLLHSPVAHADSNTDQNTANTVSVSISPEYKAAVQKYIADYKADSSNTSQLKSDIDAIYAASYHTSGKTKHTIKDNAVQVKYTGHTQNDAKVFETGHGNAEDYALQKLNADQVNELQNTMVNAINQVREQLGITQDTGTITLNNNASDITKQMTKSTFKGNVNPQLDSIFAQYGVNQDLVGDQANTDYADNGITQWLHKPYITFQTVKQYTIENYIQSSLFLRDNHLTTHWENNDENNTLGKQILGITTWQLDNITKQNVKNSYVGLWENMWQNNNYPTGGDHFRLLFIPNNTDSFTGTDNEGNTVTNTDAYNNFANANTNDTAQVGSSNIPDPNKTATTKKPAAKKKTVKKVAKKKTSKKTVKKLHKATSKKTQEPR